jgi:hypothetical protein
MDIYGAMEPRYPEIITFVCKLEDLLYSKKSSALFIEFEEIG